MSKELIEHNGRRFVRTGEVRYPKRGEWYTDENDIPWRAYLDHGSDDKPRPILRELPARKFVAVPAPQPGTVRWKNGNA